MNIEGVDTVFYWVTDIDRALEFYTGVLGIEPGPRHGDWQGLEIPGPVTFALHGGGGRVRPSTRPFHCECQAWPS